MAEEPLILYRDRHVVVACKPPGLDVQGRSAEDPTSFVAMVARSLGVKPTRLHPASRLDRPVSGLVPLARSRRGRQALTQQYQRRLVRRRYVALVLGTPSPPQGTWEAPIGRDPADRRRQAVDVPGAKPAQTRYGVVTSLGGGCALVELRPATGRTHQLRVHLSAAGCPVLGDRRYGGPTRVTLEDGSVVGVPRVMLHAARLSWRDPETGEGRSAEAEIPKDMAELLSCL